MHLHNAIGQLFMVGIPDPIINRTTRTQLQDLRPGGVILFRRNYTDPVQFAALCDELHTLFPDQPLLTALDHEGGRVHLLMPPFTHFPSARRVGQTKSLELAQRVGRAMGAELSSIGIDINFAPVLDVLTNVNNTVIGDRAFTSDPQTVGLFGCAQARGLRESGVIPCGKHFPGHGATQLDSHEDLPRDERSLQELQETDLYPFQLAINEGIEMILTAHIVYPALDPEFPATMSRYVINNLLRQQCRYQGVVVTDDLEMGAIVRHHTVAHAAVQALCAGADLLLICHNIDIALTAREACLHALADGRLTRQRLDEAGQRLTTLRRQYAHQQRSGKEKLGAEEYRQLAQTIMDWGQRQA
jgi:beta-N-acetylhexosaminidase